MIDSQRVAVSFAPASVALEDLSRTVESIKYKWMDIRLTRDAPPIATCEQLVQLCARTPSINTALSFDACTLQVHVMKSLVNPLVTSPSSHVKVLKLYGYSYGCGGCGIVSDGVFRSLSTVLEASCSLQAFVAHYNADDSEARLAGLATSLAKSKSPLSDIHVVSKAQNPEFTVFILSCDELAQRNPI